MGWHRFACNFGSVGAQLARDTGARHVTEPGRRLHQRGLEQELRRDVDARTLFGEPRLSREDENRMAAETRARDATAAQERRAKRQAEVEALAVEALDALDRLRSVLRSQDKTDEEKAIDHHARRLGAQVRRLGPQ